MVEDSDVTDQVPLVDEQTDPISRVPMPRLNHVAPLPRGRAAAGTLTMTQQPPSAVQIVMAPPPPQPKPNHHVPSKESRLPTRVVTTVRSSNDSVVRDASPPDAVQTRPAYEPRFQLQSAPRLRLKNVGAACLATVAVFVIADLVFRKDKPALESPPGVTDVGQANKVAAPPPSPTVTPIEAAPSPATPTTTPPAPKLDVVPHSKKHSTRSKNR